jgi:hypothetical protein
MKDIWTFCDNDIVLDGIKSVYPPSSGNQKGMRVHVNEKQDIAILFHRYC